MIFITGDTHGFEFKKLNNKNFLDHKITTKDDYIIITGDFGLIWNNSNEEKHWRKWLDNKSFTTLFIDGNHECVHKDSEILTEKGWMNIVKLYNEIEDIKIANFDILTGKVYYDYPLEKIKNFSNIMIEMKSPNFHQIITPNHDVIINNMKIKANDILDKKIQECELNFVCNHENSINLNDREIELLTCIIMDGTIVDSSKYNPNSKKVRIQFHLKKIEKVNYFSQLLNELNIKFSIKNKNDEYYICIFGDYARNLYNKLNRSKTIPNEWRNMSQYQFEIFLKSVSKTDGTKIKNVIVWRTIDKNAMNIVQEICAKNGYNIAVTNGKYSGYESDKIQYIVRIGKKRLNKFINIKTIEYNDYAYCFSMPKGTLITRFNDNISFTGNCFNLLNSYPVEIWNGGKVHKITDSIIHLMRGQVYNINGKKIFTFGGANSVDKEWRKENISWWPQEMPNTAEYEEGLKNLENNNWNVDYILTHTCSSNTINILSKFNRFDLENDSLTEYFNIINEKVKYKHWYFGHFHQDMEILNNQTVIYNKVIRIF